MGLEIKQDNTTAFVGVQDEMTIYTVALHWDQLSPLLAQVKAMELDLSAVTEIDSAGVQLLLALKQESTRLHNRFELCRPNDGVVELLQLLRLEQALPVAAGVSGQEAVCNG
ncbi:MAG: STAS domain-containing protein [Oceanospirillales bacterium]|uniref:Anti-anti-sigma factor n=1 Tax=Marinobacterium halophilum TaxID=267374 RepID=A0A2P8F230_9GAMM|nr:STAS domain-containing protein [Marinobacterium halophilum]MBR9827627.1 STAS domain-containing protein [Oceanospirillales bacterium]PSL15773.1 anti-anti-sigma factor [Marinobacterium halophilum]